MGFLFLILYLFVSILPLATKTFTISISGFQINRIHLIEAIFAPSYIRLQLAAVFLSIPPFLHLLFDGWNLFDFTSSTNNILFRQEYISYFFLISSLVIPNITIFIYFQDVDVEDVTHDMLFVCLTMVRTHQIILLYGFLLVFFNHPLKFSRYTDSKLAKFPFSIEKRSVNIMFLMFSSALFSTLNGTVTGKWSYFRILSIVLFVFGVLLSLGIVVRIFVIIFRQLLNERFVFRSDHHLSEFLYSALCIFYIVFFTVFSIFGAIHHRSHTHVSGDKDSDLLRYLMSFVVVEIVLMCLFNLFPEMKFQKLAASKHDQLETRLNLIRYVSHEMRTPLNTVSMGMSILKEEIRDRMQKSGLVNANARIAFNEMLETVHQINDSCNVAISTLDDLLTFDKIDENKLVIETEEINPWTLLQDTARPFNLNALIKKIQFQVQLLTEVSYQSGTKEGNTESLERMFEKYCIRGDSFKLAQVIRNLLSNALKFTPESGKVDVSLVFVEEESHLNTSHHHKGPMIQFVVKDTGAGISKANMSKLFGQYIQFNASQLQKGKGSGLGLWISKSK
jgi:signal transduction histidine kinase